MPKRKATFTNKDGETLAGLLELPEQKPQAFALFAHCFTCSKDIAAASRITRGLAAHGIATLRFDFTGLGNSDGDFANTNFSSNLADLIAAARYLEANYSAPQLLIGHSLGGAAVLAAAHAIPSARGVVTIGAPATADHVRHLFADSKDVIESKLEATVDLGGRQFTIKKQFLEDLERYTDDTHIKRLKKALLLFHSPADTTVPVDQAARIYTAAKHPKSFVSLDKADHLLSKREDSQYVADVIASWTGRYIESEAAQEAAQHAPEPGTVLVVERDEKFTNDVVTSQHQLGS